MSRKFRIGVQIDLGDPFWVQVREALDHRAAQQGVMAVPLDLDYPHTLPTGEHASLIEELLAQELDALICLDWPEELAARALQFRIPIIQLAESEFRHPLFVSIEGLYDIARDMGQFIARKLGGQGRVLAIGGQLQRLGEDGKSRLAGLSNALREHPGASLTHLPSLWTYESAYKQMMGTAWPAGEHFDAVFGFSDSLALAGRDAGFECGLIDSYAIIAGINGDPLALAAIVDGSMTATVRTSVTELAKQALDLAVQAAQKQPLPAHFKFKPSFVTAQNVSQIAVEKLTAMANLPSKLIDDNRQQTQQRLLQLETSLKFNYQVGTLLDRQRLCRTVADLIQESYGYDTVRVYLWDETACTLTLDPPDEAEPGEPFPLEKAGLLGEALRRSQPIFIPDTQHSQRFTPDPAWPETRSRVIVPIRLGEAVLGLVDLHSRALRQHLRQDLIGLQALADQLGIAIRNAELYIEAVKAREKAEQAAQIKTRLLANVSHELRTPLNVILGYAATPLTSPNPYPKELPPELLRDLRQIYMSGEHLLRVINDLLDLSRAEINALDLFPELIQPRLFLEQTFQALSESVPTNPNVAWRLHLPEQLPLIQADPVRLRQILFNLLSNAYKFTDAGEIILGAEVEPPNLHIWVKDTGSGIPIDQQERIFEPFTTSMQTKRHREGIGLGLSITRRLVLLHGGSMALESRPGQGSTFHLYLPLPSLSGQPALEPGAVQPALAVLSASETLPDSILDLSGRQGWAIHRVRSQADLPSLLSTLRPAALAWDLTDAKLSDWDLIQKVRLNPHLAQMPFILFGAGSPSEPGSSLGLTDFLVKPLSRQTLMEAIQALRPSELSGPVLIVDDDRQARDLYALLAAEAFPGCPVRRAAGGAEALKSLDEETPALVILDLHMPDVDGFSVLENLRARQATRRVPVIVMSGHRLTFEDVQRLDHLYVSFQSKNILSEDETTAVFQRALAVAKALPPQTSVVVKYILAYFQQNYHRPISRQELASMVGVSKDYLSHIFQQELGLSPWEYLLRYRIQHAKTLLRSSHDSITEIAAQAGFEDLSYFNRVFRKQVGCTPSAYRKHPTAF